ncbi:hypothetical protein [Arsenicicoccus dermatophilus]|uniref:hypothetical protein n=1 Tax=Arsenicicoccus dermatophilus TaxID=1076331 RepID=UPI001F4D0D97|nr:hypothetical protein [Arsenicicoccus dermatophilus]MCH8612324.1 hypothetical protein [Arsenicicoccus dermatophilus]
MAVWVTDQEIDAAVDTYLRVVAEQPDLNRRELIATAREQGGMYADLAQIALRCLIAAGVITRHRDGASWRHRLASHDEKREVTA